MKNNTLFILLFLFVSIAGCKKEDTDKILGSLSTSKVAYEAASNGTWIEITSAEYNALATSLSSVTRLGVSEANYTNVASNIGSSTAGYTFAQNDGATMPSGSYLFAFKNSLDAGTNTGAKVKVSSTSVNSGYSDIGTILPNHGAGEHYFVLKGNSTPTTSTGFMAYTTSSGVSINYKEIVGTGEYFYAVGDVNSMAIDQTGSVFLAQGLSTTNKQW